jgi:hypothetical protein
MLEVVPSRRDVSLVYLQQLAGEVPIDNAVAVLAVLPDGRIAGLTPRIVTAEALSTRPRVPTIDAAAAVLRGAESLDLPIRGIPVPRGSPRGPERAQLLSAPGLSTSPIEARLRYVESGKGRLHLVWSFDLRPPGSTDWWELHVDAGSGERITLRNRTRYDQYRVFAPPLESPDAGPRTLEIDPADPDASPHGWHDLDGLPGADATDSQGNNVFAADNSQPGVPISLAEGGTSRIFDFPLDLAQSPDSYRPAAVTNLFYWVNRLHDLHLHYGFDEVSGNFQEVHYLDGSMGAGDAVTAFAQDFNDANNASMATPADGSEPVLRMHRWSVPVLELDAPVDIAARHEAGGSEFGPDLTSGSTSGSVVAALDPSDESGPSTRDACSPLTNATAVSGNIALVDRGTCLFIEKVDNAESAGAIAVIVANNVEGSVFTMAGQNPMIDVPSVLVRKAVGEEIRAQLDSAQVVSATLRQLETDSDLDSSLIVHEYGHGVSTRLSGGPSNVSCLLDGQAAGMGEGWSDFWAMALTATATDAPAQPRMISAYLNGEPGIRNFPYSTELALNPQTFSDITTTNAPHGIGEIWAQSLWELYWILIGDLGFDADLIGGSGGNNIALQLVMDALKQQPCDPDFVQARDALLVADLIHHGQAHECRIWKGFAKRGLGFGADATEDPNGMVTESFAFPPACPRCGDANLDGLVDGIDVDLQRNELAAPGTLTPEQLADCDARALSGSCGLIEVVRLRRGLTGLMPGLDGSCAASP